MAVPTQEIALDVGRVPGRYVAQSSVYLGEGDRNGTVLVVTVTENRQPFDCSAYTPFLMVPLGDATYRQEGTADGDSLVFEVDESRLGNFHGTVGNAYVSLEQGGQIVTSTNRFTVVVAESAADGAEPETYASDLDALYVRAESLIAALEEYQTGTLTDGDMAEIFG